MQNNLLTKQNQLKTNIDIINNKIKNLQIDIEKLNLEKNNLTKQLQDICDHQYIFVEKYLDYDRNKFTVICKKCNKTLLDYVNIFEFKTFIKNYKGELTEKL